MLKYYLFIYFSLFIYNVTFTQITFYQDIVRGGVTGAGVSIGLSEGQTSSFNVNIPSNSTIKKAFFICYNVGEPKTNYYILNNDTIWLEKNHTVNNFICEPNLFYSPINNIIKDITSIIDPNITHYSIKFPIEPLGHQLNWGYKTAYLLIIYENLTLPNTSLTLIFNDKNYVGFENYYISNLFPITLNFPIGLSILSDLNYPIASTDITDIYINNILAGSLIGNDNDYLYSASGVRGDFYYNNNSLFGLGNDTQDTLFGSNFGDGLANIQNYLSSTSSFNMLLKHKKYQNMSGFESPNLAFILAYTSPCDTFSVTHTPDTTVCHGAQVPLFASGGQSYEWSPQVGLSCYDCPNPIFSADSSRYYSLRIWNNDSCSKVLPLHIVVKEPLPDFNFAIQPSECGDSTGSITITPVINGFSYINQTSQDTNTTGVFNTLSSGNYSFSILNADNCPFDTLIFVPETLSVNASFTSNPNAGVSPLPVAFTNTSSQANSYQWIYENQTSNQENISFTFQQDGIYPVMLIAYGNSQLCADTAYDTIYVYLPIEVEIPNIFTPNLDQNNDQWGIKINVPAEVDLQIFNRWGEVVLHKKEDISAPGFIPLWDGAKHVGGVYYYVIRVQTDFEKKEFKGNITLVR